MSNFLLGRTRLARLTKNLRQHLRLVLTVKSNDFVGNKRFFVSQVNTVLFKDCDSKKGNFSKSPSCSQSNKNPCERRTSDVPEIASEECSRKKSTSVQISSVSDTNSCDSDQRKSSIESRQYESSRFNDYCPRDCKLSACSFPVSTPVKNYPQELSPSPFSPPTKEDDKKRRFWKLLALLGALPISLVASLIVKSQVEEESKKPRPKYVPMEYMYRRTKRFPWGDGNHSFFHNPERNAVPPDGYEVEDPNEVKVNN